MKNGVRAWTKDNRVPGEPIERALESLEDNLAGLWQITHEPLGPRGPGVGMGAVQGLALGTRPLLERSSEPSELTGIERQALGDGHAETLHEGALVSDPEPRVHEGFEADLDARRTVRFVGELEHCLGLRPEGRGEGLPLLVEKREF